MTFPPQQLISPALTHTMLTAHATVHRVRSFTLPALTLALAGCATTARLNNFDVLSKAGGAYSDAMVAAVDYAESLGVQADSAVLIETRSERVSVAQDLAAKEGRKDLSEDEQNALFDTLLNALTTSDDLLAKQMQVLADIRHHVGLLKDYFAALGLLAGAGDTDSAIGESASGLLTSMGNISKGLAGVKVGEQTLAEFAGAGTPLIVAQLRAHNLEAQLRQDGQLLDRELKTLGGLAAFLTEKIRSDSQAVQGPQETTLVTDPYTSFNALPEDWASKRVGFFQRKADLSALNAVQDAAGKLRLALRAAAEGRIGADQLAMTVKDMNTLADWLAKLKHGGG